MLLTNRIFYTSTTTTSRSYSIIRTNYSVSDGMGGWKTDG